MNKFIISRCLPLVLFFFIACDSGFDEMNTNQTEATTVDPAFQLNSAIINMSYPGSMLVYDMGILHRLLPQTPGF